MAPVNFNLSSVPAGVSALGVDSVIMRRALRRSSSTATRAPSPPSNRQGSVAKRICVSTAEVVRHHSARLPAVEYKCGRLQTPAARAAACEPQPARRHRARGGPERPQGRSLRERERDHRARRSPPGCRSTSPAPRPSRRPRMRVFVYRVIQRECGLKTVRNRECQGSRRGDLGWTVGFTRIVSMVTVRQ